MSTLRNILMSLDKSLKRIKLIDRCLIIFMIILMAESIYNLFSGKVNTTSGNDIDVVIRTTSAAIFGYFLSGNFIRKSKSKVTNCCEDAEALNKKLILLRNEKTQEINKEELDDKNYIAELSYNKQKFPNNKNKTDIGETIDDNEKEQNASNQQIIIATIIGLIALIVLMIARNSNDLTDKSIATITEMRDFVSGCVGFLLGCPTKVNK